MLTQRIFDELSEALKAEILEAERHKREVDLIQGKLEEGGEQFYYSFNLEEDVYLSEDADITLKVDNNSTKGTVVSINPSGVLLALESNLGKNIKQARLLTDTSFILKALMDRVKELDVLRAGNRLPYLCSQVLSKSDLKVPLVSVTTTGLSKNKRRKAERYGIKMPLVSVTTTGLNEDQKMAVRKVCTLPISFIWGPPGTGKTTVLANAVKELIAQGERVLVMAHSNSAVDAAAIKVGEALKDTPRAKEGLILRYGVALPEVRHHPFVSEEGLLEHLYPRQIARLTELTRLAARKDEKDKPELSLKEIDAELKALRKCKDEHRNILLAGADVVLCTLSKMVIDSRVRANNFTAIIIDEASMAYIPFVLVASSLASNRVSVFGDFKQLPPMAQAGKNFQVQKWLQRDVFDEAGITQTMDTGGSDSRLGTLRVQYRMHPHIRQIVSDYCYHGNLQDGVGLVQKVAEFTRLPPVPGAPIVLINTESLLSVLYTGPHRKSYFNPVSALLAVLIAQNLVGEKGGKNLVGIITPYTAQAAFMRILLAELRLSQTLVASTVHRFQGQEKGVIIYDLPDSNPLTAPSKFISTDELSNRLHNVAISRARGKLIELANFEFMDRCTPKPCSLDTLHTIMRMHSSDIQSPFASNMLKDANGSSFSTVWYSNARERRDAAAVQTFREDLKNAQQEISIFWPDDHPAHFQRYVPLRSISSKAKIINFAPKDNALLIQNIPINPIFTQIRGDEREAIFCIDQGITWFMHWHYIHSRNITNNCLVAIRVQSDRVVKYLYPIFWPEAKKPNDTSVKENWEWVCTQCHKPLTMERGRDGPMKVCLTCGAKLSATLDDANQYLQEMKQTCYCGMQLKAVRSTFGSEVIIVLCPRDSTHFRKRLQEILP